jgi:acetoin utilization protein AcuB
MSTATTSTKASRPKARRTSNETVGALMTKAPRCIVFDAPVAWAHDMMRNHGVRHLPVVRDNAVVGMVTLVDLYLIETLEKDGMDESTVDEIMKQPLLVSPADGIREVAAKMADAKIEAAVIVDELSAPLGVFTVTDALRALSRG